MDIKDSNTLTAIKYFKKNYMIMIFFILISLIITGTITHKYYKDNELYFSNIKIRTNGSIKWNIPDFDHPHIDILYFFENKSVDNIKLIQSPNSNNIIQIEIPHKSAVDTDNEHIKKIQIILEEYKQLLIKRVNNHADKLHKRLEERALNTNNEILIKSFNLEIESLLARRDTFLELLEDNELYSFQYDGKINIKKAKRQMVKNLTISFMLSIILIIFSLWLKLVIREIKKNS